jgi:integral membrane sensor domain MASE1
MAAVVRIPELRQPSVLGLQTLAIALVYFVAGRLGLIRQLVVGGAVYTPIWPPTGIALACLLVLGLRCWTGIALGALLVILSITSIGPTTAVTVFGNTAAPVCSYLMLRRVGFRTDMNRLRDGLVLVFLGALTGMLISPTIGVGLLVLTDKLPIQDFGSVWLAWWVGDAMGVLLVTPLLLMLYRMRPPLRLARWQEAVALALTAFALVPLATRSDISLLFLVYPLLIWTALRFQFMGSMICALFASVMATVAATDAVGPFGRLTHTEVMVKLQAFNGTMALTALLLSAVITEQRNTRSTVERACQELIQVLDHLAAGQPPSRAGPGQPPSRAGPPKGDSGPPDVPGTE